MCQVTGFYGEGIYGHGRSFLIGGGTREFGNGAERGTFQTSGKGIGRRDLQSGRENRSASCRKLARIHLPREGKMRIARRGGGKDKERPPRGSNKLSLIAERSEGA